MSAAPKIPKVDKYMLTQVSADKHFCVPGTYPQVFSKRFSTKPSETEFRFRVFGCPKESCRFRPRLRMQNSFGNVTKPKPTHIHPPLLFSRWRSRLCSALRQTNQTIATIAQRCLDQAPNSASDRSSVSRNKRHQEHSQISHIKVTMFPTWRHLTSLTQFAPK